MLGYELCNSCPESTCRVFLATTQPDSRLPPSGAAFDRLQGGKSVARGSILPALPEE